MYPSSFKIRAISALIFEYGTNNSGFCACAPLRTRDSKSAIGSVTVLMQYLGSLRDRLFCAVAERHPHFAEQRFGFRVRASGGHDSNIKSNIALDFIELDFGENRLVGNTKGIVAMTIESARRNSPKITNARQRRFNQSLEEFVHPFAPQSHLRADSLVLAQLKIRNALLRPSLGCTLSRD